MRFLHFSDLNVGSASESARRWGGERSREIKETLDRIIREAETAGADLLIVSGGLFAHQPVTAELEEVNRKFLSVPSVHVVITAGAGDIIRKNSPVRSFRWAPNVHYVLSGAPEIIRFPALNTVVCAMSETDFEKPEKQALSGMLAETGETADSVKIAVFSASGEKEALEQLEGAEFSYAALGGKSSHTVIRDGKMCWSGAAEPCRLSDTGAHGIVSGTIVNGVLSGLTFRPFASVSYIPLTFSVNPKTENAGLCETIEREITENGAGNIYAVRLTGIRNPDMEPDLGELLKRYRIAAVSDETQPEYDLYRLFEEHKSDIIGQLVGSYRRNQDSMAEIDKKGFYYAVGALLKSGNKENTD